MKNWQMQFTTTAREAAIANGRPAMKARHTADYRITLHAQTSDLPAIVRLRQLLKLALRAYRFRCTGLEEIHEVPVDQRERPEEVLEETL